MSLGDWEPFWLGSSSRRLFAALHASAGSSATGVILVPPLLHELPRSRRFIAEVANEFAAIGLPTLRFDFHGSGDSAGSGAELDFASMHRDIDLAVAALRQKVAITRLVLLAWRGSALVLRGWLDRGGAADLVVLWEPIADGRAWLEELVETDVRERELRPPPRSGIARITDPADGQLMGFPASARLRDDLAQAHREENLPRNTPAWAVVRADATELPADVARVLRLPPNAPSFNAGAAMDATFFLTPPVRDLVGELGQAVRREVA